MKSDRGLPVAIVGGGFSGTMVAAQLARKGIDAVLIDGSGRAGQGVAYSTTDAAHVLNIQADVMSAWPFVSTVASATTSRKMCGSRTPNASTRVPQ